VLILALAVTATKQHLFDLKSSCCYFTPKLIKDCSKLLYLRTLNIFILRLLTLGKFGKDRIMSNEENTQAYSGPKYAGIEKFKQHDMDGGSSEVQVAILTSRLAYLGEHFKKHPQDAHSQRGMQAIINKRKKLLAYLKKSKLSSYKTVIAELGIRK
jgi:small subunit ribosomal protein S15